MNATQALQAALSDISANQDRIRPRDLAFIQQVQQQIQQGQQVSEADRARVSVIWNRLKGL